MAATWVRTHVLMHRWSCAHSCVCRWTIAGQLLFSYCYFTGKLRLKIPWKNLYNAPVVAEVDGLYALAGPAAGEGGKLSMVVGS